MEALLVEQKLEINPLDKLSTVQTAALREGSVVKLTRIVKKRVTKTETIAFSTTKKNSAKLYEAPPRR